MSHRERRTYDHRIKAQITATGNPTLFPELEIPHSTAMSWIRRGVSVPDELAEKRREARQRRVEQNRRVTCSTCPCHSEETGRDIAA
jgi:hypothetical protein